MKTERPTLLTVEELAAMLKRSPKTVYDWVAQKKIPCTKLPTGGVLFNLASINEWLDSHSQKAA